MNRDINDSLRERGNRVVVRDTDDRDDINARIRAAAAGGHIPTAPPAPHVPDDAAPEPPPPAAGSADGGKGRGQQLEVDPRDAINRLIRGGW